MGDRADPSFDERFDVAKQLRIAERNRRTVMMLGDERVRREALFPLWMLGLGVSFILGGLALTVHVLGSLRGLL